MAANWRPAQSGAAVLRTLVCRIVPALPQQVCLADSQRRVICCCARLQTRRRPPQQCLAEETPNRIQPRTVPSPSSVGPPAGEPPGRPGRGQRHFAHMPKAQLRPAASLLPPPTLATCCFSCHCPPCRLKSTADQVVDWMWQPLYHVPQNVGMFFPSARVC